MAKELYLDFKGLQQYDAIVEEKIQKAIADTVNFEVKVVDSLPQSGEEHILYLAKQSDETCVEYLWVENKWEMIGTTLIDLSEYAKTTDVNASLELKADKSQLEDYATKNDISIFITEEDLQPYAKIADVNSSLNAKQDIIEDLEVIRNNASTAVQHDELSIYATIESVNTSLENKVNNSDFNVYKESVNTSLAEKQNIITDLNEIRSNAALAVTAVQPAQIADFITVEALQPYATTESVDASLENKADLVYVDASLDNKVNNSELENYYTKEFINALVSRISVLETTVNRLDRQVNAVSYDINDVIANIPVGEKTVYTDPDGRFIIDTSTSNSKVTITILNGNELGDYEVPAELNKAFTIEGNIKSGATITNSTSKTLTVINTAQSHSNIVIESNGTVALTGNYKDIEFNGGTLNGISISGVTEYANVIGNIIIDDNVTKDVTINANFVGDDNAVISNTSQNISITARNNNANLRIECPNSTVTLNGTTQYDEVEANVSNNTLKINSINLHINKLNLKHGNIFINNGKNVLNDLVDEVICEYVYNVDWNKATVLPSSPSACEYTLEADRTGAVTWGAFATGDTVINLNNHNIHNEGTDGRPTLNVRNAAHVDINGEGNVSNNKEYCVWGNGANTVITINGGHFSGATHVIYSYNGLIEINGGEFELVGEYEKDAKGHAKFLLNCYDQSFTAGTARIIVKGGKYHNFNPAEAYGEPTQPFNYVAEGYESVCIDEANQIYEVRKI